MSNFITNKKEDLLIELGLEELPPKGLIALSQSFRNIFETQLKKVFLDFSAIEAYASPRRLAIVVSQLASRQPEREISKRGPAKKAGLDEHGNPTKALLGFAESCGVKFQDLQFEETDKGSWYVFKEKAKGKTVDELIPQVLNETLTMLPLPKRMRWGSNNATFVRPLHWLLMLFGEKVIQNQLFGIASDNKTQGHRFHAPQSWTISSPSEYEGVLEKKAWVIPGFEKRKINIQTAIQKLADEENFKPIIETALLDEVTALVEWPVVLLGYFDPNFLIIPREALIAAMQVHQKCFPITDQNDKLLNKFIIVSNIESRDPKQVIAGNEAVMHARLADAVFYFEQDQKKSLLERTEDLKHIVFQQGLGSLFDKTKRVQKLAREIATKLGVDPDAAERAALLAKADLVTNMVNEFPELQGIMGKHYALKHGEPKEIAWAIQEHYHPRFANDTVPNSLLGAAVAIADRIDTLVGIFSLGERATGEKDPFGLRRQALGLMRILIEKHLDLDLREWFTQAQENLQNTLKAVPKSKDTNNTNLMADLLGFCFERLKAFYQDQGIASTVFEAVRSTNVWNPYDFDLRIKAVNEFRLLPEADSLTAANKRVKNILEPQKESLSKTNNVNEKLLNEPQEKKLYEQLKEKQNIIEPLLEQRNYTEVLRELSTLKKAIDDFFDKVMVMTEDQAIRQNRIILLFKFQTLFYQIADISML